MPLFGKPKKKKKKKIAVGKGTLAEETKAEFNMKRRYPQMQDPNWGKPQKRKKKAKRKKAVSRRQREHDALAGALSPAELKKLRGGK